MVGGGDKQKEKFTSDLEKKRLSYRTLKTVSKERDDSSLATTTRPMPTGKWAKGRMGGKGCRDSGGEKGGQRSVDPLRGEHEEGGIQAR